VDTSLAFLLKHSVIIHINVTVILAGCVLEERFSFLVKVAILLLHTTHRPSKYTTQLNIEYVLRAVISGGRVELSTDLHVVSR
jgi:hypothetical protein